MSVQYEIKQVHNISRPGEPPCAGDTVEIECVGGFIKQVDPVTRTATAENKRFVLEADSTLTIQPPLAPMHKRPNLRAAFTPPPHVTRRRR